MTLQSPTIFIALFYLSSIAKLTETSISCLYFFQNFLNLRIMALIINKSYENDILRWPKSYQHPKFNLRNQLAEFIFLSQYQFYKFEINHISYSQKAFLLTSLNFEIKLYKRMISICKLSLYVNETERFRNKKKILDS